MNRREFIQSVSAAGAVALSPGAFAQAPAETKSKSDDLNVGIIGCGEQGRVLITSALPIPGIKFRAVCDIWEYSQQYAKGYLKKNGHNVNVYEDYREMIAKEKGLDAVIVATPDWMHAEIANAWLETGKHVYCEKEMSNSLEKARSMVLTQRKTGKLLQIGHQRRSNPRYIHAIDRLIREANLLGRVTHAYAQWNRSIADALGWPKKYAMDQAKLDKYGYVSMEQFRNWRWFKKYGGGPIVDLGSHQIDLFSWIWGCNPSAIVAMGGVQNGRDARELIACGATHVALDTVRTPGGGSENALGGSASYFSLAARSYVPVRLVAVVGEDFPPSYRDVLAKRGVDLAGLQVTGGRTFRWEGIYGADLNDRTTVATELNVFESFHPILPESYRQSRAVFLANIDPVLQEEVLDQLGDLRRHNVAPSGRGPAEQVQKRWRLRHLSPAHRKFMGNLLVGTAHSRFTSNRAQLPFSSL